MSVANGEDANETEFNTSFMSREVDTSTAGKVDLVEASSADIIDLQGTLNTKFTDITTNATNIATNVTNIATNASDIALNDIDIADLVTLSGVSANSTNLGTFTGTIITDNVTDKVALQELETQVDTNITAIGLNTAKVTNATHTGEVTGSGVLTLDKTAITNQASATVASSDTLLISDIDDSGNLKEITAQSIADLGAAGGTNNSPQTLKNLGLSTSVAAGALTINLKQSDGSTDPSTGSAAVNIGLRNTPVTDGGFSVQSYTVATNIVIPSGATLGYANGDDAFVFVYALFDGTNKELAISSVIEDESILQNTTILNTSSDTSGLFSTTARTGARIRLLGRLLVSSITTAGTWTAPDELILNHSDIDLRVDRVVEVTAVLANYTIAASTFGDLTSISLPPGDWEISLLVFLFNNGVGTTGDFFIGLGTASGTSSAGLVDGDTKAGHVGNLISGSNHTIVIPRIRKTVTSATTFFFKAQKEFDITNLQFSFKISAITKVK